MNFKRKATPRIISSIFLLLSALYIIWSFITHITTSQYFVKNAFLFINAGFMLYLSITTINIKNNSVEKLLKKYNLALILFPVCEILMHITSIFMFKYSINIIDIIALIIRVILFYLPAILVINASIESKNGIKTLTVISCVEIILTFLATLFNNPYYYATIHLIVTHMLCVSMYHVLFYVALMSFSTSIEEQNADVNTATEIVLKEESIVKSIILSILTLGIYNFIWIYKMGKKIKELNGNFSSAVAEIICFMFVPFYSLYWIYTRSNQTKQIALTKGVSISNNAVISFILVFFGLGLIALAILQNDLNIIARSPKKAYSSYQTTTANSDVETLKKLSELHNQGILSDEEYEMKKKEILERI